MNIKSISCAAAMSAIGVLFAGGAQAAMSPALQFRALNVQHVDCAVGFHIGPAGACIVGTDEERHDTVIEKRATDEGCKTKSVTRSDDMGNSETRTKTNCD